MAFTAKQIYTVVNEVAKQAYGDKTVSTIDLQGVISLGNKVLSSETDKELFMNTLINRIGVTIIGNRKYTGALKNIVRDNMEYGAIVQKLYIAPFDMQGNDSWTPKQGDPISFGSVNIPIAKQYLFENRDVFQLTVSIPDHQLKTAFTGAEPLAAFISAIYVSMETSVEQAIENMSNLCIANFIGEKIKAQDDITNTRTHCINLREQYNILNGTTLTTSQCMNSPEFLRYASREMKIIMKRIQKLTSMYNTEGLKRFTPENELNLLLLTDFVTASTYNMQADTYHNELVSLPNFSEVPYWQGLGDGSFTDVSSIKLTLASGGETFAKDGIIGMLFDTQALGVFYNRRESKAFYSPNQEITQKYEKVEMGYFNDLTENAVVFAIY